MKNGLTLPNFLSLLRLLLTPLILFLIFDFQEAYFLSLLLLYLFTVSLDFLDGFIARRMGQESELGRILDPLADKLLVLGVLVALTLKAGFPIWLALLIGARDLLIMLASFLLYRRHRIVKTSILVGKVTFGTLSLLMFVYLVDLSSQFDLFVIKEFLTTLSFVFLVWSWIEYYLIYQRDYHA
ncbi:MAG TPA: CDP-alcohol phosphatidyltransferase family protein [Candidatus Aminicenantes bacterium]|nr:CDP-alcohol phosphatidyltransferase family protein [Candidatus Aminicenantes bacterium]